MSFTSIPSNRRVRHGVPGLGIPAFSHWYEALPKTIIADLHLTPIRKRVKGRVGNRRMQRAIMMFVAQRRVEPRDVCVPEPPAWAWAFRGLSRQPELVYCRIIMRYNVPMHVPLTEVEVKLILRQRLECCNKEANKLREKRYRLRSHTMSRPWVMMGYMQRVHWLTHLACLRHNSK